MFTVTTAEKIETVVLSRQSGVFGEYVAIDGGARIAIDGRTFIVSTITAGWSVEFGPYQVIAADLLDAAREAVTLADGMRGKSVASRNVPVRVS